MVIALTCTIGELVCYIMIFVEVFKQDNGEIKKLLDPNITKRRNQKNLTTFLGQFLHFAAEIAFFLTLLIVLAFDSSNVQLKAVAASCKLVEFGILSAVDVLTSERLKEALMKDLRVVNIFPKQE